MPVWLMIAAVLTVVCLGTMTALLIVGAASHPPTPTVEPLPIQLLAPVPPVPKYEYVTVRYVDEIGRVLGEESLIRQARRVSRMYRHGVPPATDNFMAAQQTPEGIWIYRRVHEGHPGRVN
jgi:hypothetical protein